MSDLRIFKGAGVMTAGDLISRVFELLRVIFITHFFSVGDFGLYGLALGTSALFGAFVMPSFTNVLFQFFPYYKKESVEAGRKFFSSTVILTIINSAVAAVAVFLLAKILAVSYYQKPELFLLIEIAALLILLQPLVDILNSFLSSLERFSGVFWGTILFSSSQLLLIVFYYFLGFKTEGLIMAAIGAYFIQILLLFWFLRGYFVWTMPRLEKKVRRFWYPLIGVALFKNATGNLPLVIIGRLLDSVSIGLFQIAEKTVRMGFSFAEPYLNSISVVCVNTYHELRERFMPLLNTHTKYSIALTTSIGMMMIIFGELIFGILYGSDYLSAVPLFIFFILWGVFGSANLSFPRVLYSVHHKSGYYFWNSVISTIFLLPALYFLGKHYGLWGVAMAIVLSRLLALSINIFFSKKIAPDFSSSGVIMPIGIFLVFYGVLWKLASLVSGIAYLVSGIAAFSLYILILRGAGILDFRYFWKTGKQFLKR